MQNGLSIDLEDYFQVTVFSSKIRYADWDLCPSRISANTEKILALFARHGVKATFFVLGWVAQRFPALVREIASERHEIALHGYGHQVLDELTPEQFRGDLSSAKKTVEDLLGCSIKGYRAPSFSIKVKTSWALDIIKDLGFAYDSSIFRVGFGKDRLHNLPQQPFEIIPGLYELPLPIMRLAGVDIPVTGGVFLRAFPYSLTRWAIRSLNSNNIPVVIYVHPWELDPRQPRICSLSPFNTVRHYVNLSKTEGRLDKLCQDFTFVPLESLIPNSPLRLSPE